jgi:hypothetical protein
MKWRFVSLVAAAVLALAASINVQVHAQTVQLAIMGSSAQYTEAAQADYFYGGKGCFYIDGSSDSTITDTRIAGVVDHDKFWIAWSQNGGSSCSSPGAGYTIDFYMNADSVLGNRCFFASPSCKVTLSTTATYTCASPPTNVTCTVLPSALVTAVNANSAGAGMPINVAATDIRPEDGEFATIRALTPCGQPIPSSPALGQPGASQYLGIGDLTSNPNLGLAILGATWTVGGQNLGTLFNNSAGSFNVVNFAISGNDPVTGAAIANGTGNNWAVYQVGAAPELIIVNPKDTSGLGSLAVTNINRDTLAGFVDGTLGAVSDIFPQAYAAGGEVGVNVILREYLSGTMNTFEYAIPNNIEYQSSQEIGVAAYKANGPGGLGLPYPQWNCATNTTLSESTYGGNNDNVAPYNPLQETDSHTNVTSTRSRAIGTGNVVSAIEHVEDGLGYAFWSESNFSGASPGTVKYLTVDGVDPIEEVWQDGEVPTPSNNLESNVSFSNVKNGSYPIWSILRMVASNNTSSCVSTTGTQVSCGSLISTLTGNEERFVTPDFPDFVLKDQLSVVRSHFTPPTVVYPAGAPCNGDISGAETGGDVGGMVYSIQADNDVAADAGAVGVTSVTNCGILNKRQ